MKAIKQLLRPERLRQVPDQFSWVDQALVQQHFIDRCEARSAALYLFLITVSDAQGLSYYGAATLALICLRQRRSPLPMLGWGVVVTALTLVALAPLFLGLLVILPVLGHATWHLYARAAAEG